MQITLTLNGIKVTEDVAADMLLIDFVRAHGCKSVKRGCETSNCGLCTVFLDEKPVLSCSVLAARASGHSITTLEGLLSGNLCRCSGYEGQLRGIMNFLAWKKQKEAAE